MAVTASKFKCTNGHLSWAYKPITDCPHGGCREQVVCVSGPHRPKKPKA